MKLLVLLLLCSFCSNSKSLSQERIMIAKEEKVNSMNVAKECMMKHQTDLVRITALYVLGFPDYHAKCGIYCVMRHYNLVDKDGYLCQDTFNRIVEKINGTDIQEVLKISMNKCVNIIHSKERCDRAFSFTLCVQRETHKNPAVFNELRKMIKSKS